MEYSAGLTSKLFWLQESRKTASYILDDQRIYFCWGRDEIENHKIIIAKIGDHWKK